MQVVETLWRTYDLQQSYEFVSQRLKINLWETYEGTYEFLSR